MNANANGEKKEKPKKPENNWRCRWFGHSWVDVGVEYGNDVDIVRMECQRCPAESSRMKA